METRSFDLSVGPATLRVRERDGDPARARPALVFLHYFGGSGRAWEPVTGLCAAGGWRCLAPDARGFGDSPAPGEGWEHYAVDTLADDILGLVSRLEIPRFIVVGHSMGGKVALALAARRPAGLAGAALLAPSPLSPEPMPDAERARLLRGHGDEAAVRFTLEKITARPLPPSRLAEAVADNLRASAPAWRAWLERGSREDLSARRMQITAPVRVAVGGQDQTFTPSLMRREVLAGLADAGRSPEVLSGAGHLLPLEVPGAVAGFLSQAFADFLISG